MRTKPIDEVIAQQVRFSSRAFGPGPRTEGLLAHIRKEMVEINEDPKDILEWIDVVILGLDGAWRCASTQHPWLNDADVAKFVADALLYKIGVNQERSWPDWREAGQDQPIEHKRTATEVNEQQNAIMQRERERRYMQGGAPGQVNPNHNHLHLARPSQVCDHCEGTGISNSALGYLTCAFCRGRGVVEDRRI